LFSLTTLFQLHRWHRVESWIRKNAHGTNRGRFRGFIQTSSWTDWRKLRLTCQDTRSPDRGSNPRPPEYEETALTTNRDVWSDTYNDSNENSYQSRRYLPCHIGK